MIWVWIGGHRNFLSPLPPVWTTKKLSLSTTPSLNRWQTVKTILIASYYAKNRNKLWWSANSLSSLLLNHDSNFIQRRDPLFIEVSLHTLQAYKEQFFFSEGISGCFIFSKAGCIWEREWKIMSRFLVNSLYARYFSFTVTNRVTILCNPLPFHWLWCNFSLF